MTAVTAATQLRHECTEIKGRGIRPTPYRLSRLDSPSQCLPAVRPRIISFGAGSELRGPEWPPVSINRDDLIYQIRFRLYSFSSGGSMKRPLPVYAAIGVFALELTTAAFRYDNASDDERVLYLVVAASIQICYAAGLVFLFRKRKWARMLLTVLFGIEFLKYAVVAVGLVITGRILIAPLPGLIAFGIAWTVVALYRGQGMKEFFDRQRKDSGAETDYGPAPPSAPEGVHAAGE